jgi:hypothetical protein
MTILLSMFVISGMLVGFISVPLIMGKIPPNGLYGFRVKKTMENPEIWYRVNAYSGKWLLGIGIAMIMAASGFALIPFISLDFYAYAVLAVWVIIFTLAMIFSIRYLNSL